MKNKLMCAIAALSALVFLACTGLPGKYIGGGSVPSAVDDPKGRATFAFTLVAKDEIPDEEGDAETFSGQVQYKDKAAGVAIHGIVLNEEPDQGVYYDEQEGGYGQFGAFAGVWSGSLLTETGKVTEGDFVIYVRDDPDDLYGGDGLWIQLYEWGAFDPEVPTDPLYENYQEGNVKGTIRFIPVK